MRIAIADDSVLVREGLVHLLRSEGMEIVCSVGTPEELLEAIDATPPDVALVDVRMPPDFSDEGIRAAEEIDRRNSGVGVLILSQYVEEVFALRLLEQRTGGRGYLLKDRLPDVATLMSAIATISEGGSFIDPAVVEELMRSSSDPVSELSAREREILTLMAEGRSNSAICATLYLSPKTIEGYVRSIFQKLDLPPAADDHRRVLAVLRFLRAGGGP